MKTLRTLLCLAGALLAQPGVLNAITLTGTNQPGVASFFQVAVAAGTTNLAISVNGNASAFSYLSLKAGAVPGTGDFDFSAAQSSTSNAINLELPQLQVTNYFLQVSTPANSAVHAFTITVTNNVTNLRSTSRPATKPIISVTQSAIAASTWHYFRVDVPTNMTGWRVVLSSSNAGPDLYVQKDTLPTASSWLKASTASTNDVVVFTPAEVTPGTYYIGVSQGVGIANYRLQTEMVRFISLTWDPGTTHLGTAVYSQPDTNGGDYYFRITVQNSTLGAWRNALTVLSGEADLYLAKGTPPTTSSNLYKSTAVGSDGFVVPPAAFNAGEDWYLLVHSTAGSQWSLVSGDPFVTDLGVVAVDGSSGSGALAIGAEGMRFFRTTAANNQGGWRLWLNGGTNSLYLKKNALPLPTTAELFQQAQLLVVPGYLVGGQLYFIGVSGPAGAVINLDSRAHGFTDLDFVGTTNFVANGFPYATFRVQVPADQLAWQVSVSPGTGNPNIALRRDLMPNELNNDAYSEVPGSVADSITLVPDTLSDGTFFVTVYSSNAYTCTLRSGPPEVTDINYVSNTTNTDTNRVGWRIFKVADIGAQVGSLGWDLALSNAAPGTRLALRRNRAPGIWNFRNSTVGSAGFYTVLSTTNFLQVPDNPADVWYVGVYNPTNALGEFTLSSKELTASPLTFDGGAQSRMDVPVGKWQFFRVDVPNNLVGWDIRLSDVTLGSPQLVLRRERLPISLATFGVILTATNWPTGSQWAAGADWTGRAQGADGQNENGRILTAGMGRPLDPGTYYVGVISSVASTNPTSYTILSRGIGPSLTIPVVDLNYTNSSVTNFGLPARDLAVYRVNVPSNSPNWKLKLAALSGDALMAVARGAMPNITATSSGSVTNALTAGRKMQKVMDTGNEHLALLPAFTNILSGNYYVVVVSEGQSDPTNTTRIGVGSSDYILTSVGAIPQIDLGLLNTDDLVYSGTLEGGESTLVRFQNLPETLGFELSLSGKTGNPWIVSPTATGIFPNPGSKGDLYGNEGGWDGVASPDIITSSGAFPSEILAIKARGSGMNYPDASYTLRIRKLTAEPLAFDGGVRAVTAQTNIYEYFQITVPPNALGWDLRITNVTSGTPELIICRDFLALDIDPQGWLPERDTYWPAGANWIAAKDWTLRSLSSLGANEDGRILAMGMGQPLEPGTYYVGVKGGSSAFPTSYTLVSRGIGQGMSIPVADLPFAGGALVNGALAPREAAYYRVVVPEDAIGWQGRLSMVNGEAMLISLTNYVPNVLSGRGSGLGKLMQKAGDEQLIKLAANNEIFLPSGTNYLAVISEGVGATIANRIGNGNVSFIMESRGEVTPIDLGTVSATEIFHTNALQAGEVCAYQFTVPSDTTSMEVKLLNCTGSPTMVLRRGAELPNPGAASPVSGPGSVFAETYGNEGGWNIVSGVGDANTNLITVANPTNGIYSVMVKARPVGTLFTNATFTLSVRAVSEWPLAFDGGSQDVTNQSAGSWRYFVFTVPADALGWDLRLINVTNGVPKLVLRRDALPGSLTTSPWSTPGYTTNWPGTNQWAAASDWTRRTGSATGINEDNRILALGMGQPLEPGTYYGGVFNTTTSNTLSYTIVSRGIGDGFTLPMNDLTFAGGRHTNNTLAPREAAYYRVAIPSQAKGWKVKLTSFSGEALLLSLKDSVPNVDVGRSTIPLAGKVMQKAGNEHFVLLPPTGQSNVIGGTYYLAVAGEGLNPVNGRVGIGTTSYEIVSEGEVNVVDLGAVGGADLVHANSLQGGENAFYSFVVPSNTLAIEMRLDDRVGNPIMVLSTNGLLPNPSGLVSDSDYGNNGGTTPGFLGTNIITLPNPPPGTYQLAVKARANSATTYPDAAYTLRVRHLTAPTLNFTGELNTNGLPNVIASQLLDQQRAFYRVVIPTEYDGVPVTGWELNINQTSGAAGIRVRKDLLPSDTVSSGMAFASKAAVIVPPYLTPGVWFVEIRATNSTSLVLTSSKVNLQRPAWSMPGIGEAVTTPGMTAPEFGDSGVDTNGVALPGDRGIDLEAGRYHFYAIQVPTNNGGLLRMQLAAISGNPDLCLRTNLPPTFSHKTNGTAGSTFDRSMTGQATDYGNWVPIDGASETRLGPGLWYVGLRATPTANARYRLQLSYGQVQNLDLASGSATGQSLASNDWRYYRFQLPDEPPTNWFLTFSKQAGDVVMYVRDTVPPGNGSDNLTANIKDWLTDKKNTNTNGVFASPGTYTLTVPPLRPGAVYYVGLCAKVDSTFSLSSSVSGGIVVAPPTIAFYGGFVTNVMPPHSVLTYRILTPADGLRWRHTSIHSNVVQVFMENGSLPTLSANDDFRSSGANSTKDQFLNMYPWLPSQTYYVVVTNASSIAQPFSLTMNGGSNTADDDADGLPDAWEVRYFGNLNQPPGRDFDFDGVINMDEYLEGTIPNDATSVRPRLVVTSSNGSVTTDPLASNYASGTSVSLVAVPNIGYEFTGWSGAIVSKANPLVFTITSNMTVNAKFRVPGDDFEQRISLSGSNAVAGQLSNTGATKEAGEPAHAGNSGGRSLWWTWVAPASGQATVSTDGSTFRTLLAAYTGNSVNGLSLVASNAAGVGATGTNITFQAVAGWNYHFAVDGYVGSGGMASLAISLAGTQLPVQLVQAQREAGGGFSFHIFSTPGAVLRVQSASSFGGWSTVATITNATGDYSFADPDAPGSNVRFFRAVVGP